LVDKATGASSLFCCMPYCSISLHAEPDCISWQTAVWVVSDGLQAIVELLR
jgi:hypothetical protein